MLKEFSEQIVADLNAASALIDLLDASGVSSLLSEEEDGDSFVNYAIRYNGNESKDGVAEYQVFIDSWSDTYTKSISIADQVTAALAAALNQYKYVSAIPEPVFNEGTGKTNVVTKQIFNIYK